MKHVYKSISALLTVLLCVMMLIPQNGYAASKPTLTVDSISAKAGSSVTVDVSVKDNPGILGMTLTVDYDEGLTLVSGQSGEAFSVHTMTRPGQFVSGCNFVWDAQELKEGEIKDGSVLRMVFDVAGDVPAGTDLGIRINCDATDLDLMAVDANIVNGKVRVIADPVEQPDLESISAVLAHNEFFAGEELVLDELEVLAEYSDNTTKVLNKSEYTVDTSGIDMSTPGTQYLKISYTENDVTKTTDVAIVVKAVLTGIELKPSKTVYKAGNELDLSGLTVMATYSNNLSKKVTNYQTNAAEIDMNTAGSKTIVVTYSENGLNVSNSYTITVEPVLKGIEASKEKTNYLAGDTLNVNDLTVVASYIGQGDKQVFGYTVDTESVDMSTPGEKTLKISYNEGDVTKTAEVIIKVEKVLVSISAEKETTSYSLNDVVDLNDLRVIAEYSDGSGEVVEGYTTNIDSLDLTSVGTKKLVIEYSENGVSKKTVIELTITADIYYIEATKEKVTYTVGEMLNVDDLTVTAYFQDNSSTTVTDFSTNADSIDMSTAGTKRLTVIYEGASTTIQIIVREASHADDQEKADEVSAIIENIDPNNWESVEAAREAYDALSDDQKELVTNIAALEAAEQKIASETTDLNTLEYEEIPDMAWDGLPYWPCYYSTWLKTEDPDMLYEGTDYVVEYQNDTEVGMGTAILKGRGKYRGTKVLTYNIVPLNMSAFSSDFRLSASSYVYDGKVKSPKLKLKDENVYYAPEPTADDYIVTYSTNRKSIGSHKVTFEFYGNYTGKLTYSFKINPKATAWKSLTATSKGFTAKWAKRTIQTTGYQIQYSTSSTFKTGNKILTITKNSTISKKVTKLKAKKKYYVRIRTYKTVGGQKYYSAWTAKRAVTTKR